MELQTKWMGKPWCFAREIDSTNEWAKREAKKGASSGTLYIAENQTKGKGRRGRSWADPKGSGLAMSLLLRPDIPPERASMLTIVMGLSAAQAVKDITGITAYIKWPNDLVMSGKKLTGILTEMAMEGGRIAYVVIGIGINLNMESFPEGIRHTATSLKLEGGREIDRDQMAAAVLNRFEKNYESFLETCSLQNLKEDYNNLLTNKDHEVKVLEKSGELTGVSIGINDLGELLVRKPDGTVQNIFAGEVSVRGLYGYV